MAISEDPSPSSLTLEQFNSLLYPPQLLSQLSLYRNYITTFDPSTNYHTTYQLTPDQYHRSRLSIVLKQLKDQETLSHLQYLSALSQPLTFLPNLPDSYPVIIFPSENYTHNIPSSQCRVGDCDCY